MSTTNTKPPVLICGAGPSGMALALWLHKLGTPFRIIDKLSGPGQTSRATVVHARTLELYRQLGIAERLISSGIKVENVIIKNAGVETANAPLTAGRHADLSPYPFMLSLPQDIHEAILVDVLRERGVQVERNVELLTAVDNDAEGVVETKIKLADGTEESFTASYIAGCDGAHSTVRHIAGINMEGGTYAGRFFVADADIDPATAPAGPKDLNMNLSRNEYTMVLPMVQQGHVRLIGFVPKDKAEAQDLTFADVEPTVLACVPKLKVNAIKWFSAYKVHHRVANHYQRGRFFLCGDACHLHSPVGGQGMNTGIGDASNLAWKLAYVHSGRAAPQLLDTYEPERSSFAHSLVKTTDAGFTALTDEGWKGWICRELMVPYIIPTLMKWTGHSAWEITSQINIEYRSSELSLNADTVHGTLKAGDRLPYVHGEGAEGKGDAPSNFDALEETRWQVHVYGEAERDMRRDLQAHGLEVRKFEWSEAAGKRGLAQGALYLVRPDGYVGAVAAGHDAQAVVEYLGKWGLEGSF